MMNRSIQFFKQKAYEFRWALLSGVLVGTTYIPFPPWALLFCYAPLWMTVVQDDKGSWKKHFFAGWLTQFILTLIGFHWIAYTAKIFGDMPWVVSGLALLLFCAFMHLYIPVAVTLGMYLKKQCGLSAKSTFFVMALLHSLLERIWPVIFDWNLGYTLLWAQLPVYQLADIFGFFGLSTLVLLFNAAVAAALVRQPADRPRWKNPQLAMLLLLFVLLNIAGHLWGQDWKNTDRRIQVTIVQANIGNADKIMAEVGRGSQNFIIQKFIDLTKEAAQKFPETDVFVWPETAFPYMLDTAYLDRPWPRLLQEQFQGYSQSLITGAYSRDFRNQKDTGTYNALFLADLKGQNLDKPYRKTHLLAFGEYLPFTETFPILLKWLPFISNFGRGEGPMVLGWNFNGERINWGPQICYEGLYPEFSRGSAKAGSDILVNVTNDSWFGVPFEPRQHLYMTLARAIEVRRPLVRSTNTGISTAILASGQVLQQSPTHKEWSGVFDIAFRKDAPQTVYTRWGHYDWFLISLTLILILLLGAFRATSRRS